jgi:hypothetical protein
LGAQSEETRPKVGASSVSSISSEEETEETETMCHNVVLMSIVFSGMDLQVSHSKTVNEGIQA